MYNAIRAIIEAGNCVYCGKHIGDGDHVFLCEECRRKEEGKNAYTENERRRLSLRKDREDLLWERGQGESRKAGESNKSFSKQEEEMNEQWWIFTFGAGQEHAGYYVKVWGTYGTAREKMVRKYGLHWGFQYTEKEWNEFANDPKRWWPMEKELEVME